MICAKRENKNAGDGVRILNIITLNHRRAESVIMYYIKSVRLIRLRVVSGCYYVYYRLRCRVVFLLLFHVYDVL